MDYFPQRPQSDYFFEVAQQKVPGRSSIRVIGRNSSVGTSEEDLWEVSTTYNFLTSADHFRIKSGGNANDTAAGTGATEIKLTYLSSTGAIIEDEAIATAGASASSNTANTGIRLISGKVSLVGTYGGQSAGDIDIETAGGTLVGRIATSVGETRLAIYSVPLGKTGYIRRVRTMLEGNKTADVFLYTREGLLTTSAPMQPKIRRLAFDQLPGGTSEGFTLEYPIELPALTDVWWSAEMSSGSGAVSAAMEIEIENNS